MLHFLPPGHTHEDVDQLFSIWKKLLKSASALMPADFLDLIERAYQNEESRPELVAVETVWDWKIWFLQHMNRLSHHTVPHYFHVYQNAEGAVVMKAKTGATNGIWSEEIDVLSIDPDSFPQPIPRAAILANVLADTRACLNSGILSPEQKADWEQILALYAEPEPVETFDNSTRFDRLRMPLPPPRIRETEEGIVRIACVPRTVPPRSDFTAYVGLFIAVAPAIDQADGQEFWIACVTKVCPTTLKVHWWTEGEDQIWMPDPDYEGIDKIRPATVISSLPNFEINGFMITEEERVNINSILQGD